MQHEALQKALPSDNVGLNAKNVAVKDLKRGYVASTPKMTQPRRLLNLHPRSLSGSQYTEVIRVKRRVVICKDLQLFYLSSTKNQYKLNLPHFVSFVSCSLMRESYLT
ncbi:hypothetical protein SUGI_0763760 [Cryptomeria japonica]|nr:hypothetical protein SUGI_0763590 [Cryptomeria japonica]GLJ37579.1 hypothetical protein SUGI_0763680 [Cryptomeria japonica]GLJ37587.1 hypothetical protein SUGI_0763760 [Cryptomeria japonica]